MDRRRFHEIRQFSSYADAKSAVQDANEFENSYGTQYKSKWQFTWEFKYRLHLACNHRLKITRLEDDQESAVFMLKDGGEHDRVETVTTRHVIDPRLRKEVDFLLQLGDRATRIRNQLLQKFAGDQRMTAAFRVIQD